MATIRNPQLTIGTDRAHDKATVTVVCDVEFTEFEVNAMNLLGLRYSLHCELLDMDMLYEPAEGAVSRTGIPDARARRNGSRAS